MQRMIRYLFNLGLLGLFFLTGLCISGCEKPFVLDDLEAIQARGELIFITRNSPTSFFEGPHGPAGFEYELVKAFADHIGVRPRPLIIEEEAEMITALRNGEADIIAAGIPFGKYSTHMVALGPGYLEVEQQIVGRRGDDKYQKIDDLDGKMIWMTGSSARLETIKAQSKTHPALDWKILSDYSSDELLQMVWKRSLPLTMVESHTFNISRRFYPELVVHFSMGNSKNLAWAIDPQSRHLLRETMAWFARPTTRKQLQGLKDFYFGHLEDFDYVDLARYRRRITKRLPKYKAHFKTAAEKYGLDWHMVAAQSYQESHWNPKAKSFTGVRGIMMLTQDTAKNMGLKNRLAAKEGIFAGTRYLATLHEMVGDEVSEPDRTYMALAAYNLGFGHLQDARQLAMHLDMPANAWQGIRAVLPLLQKKKYYRTLSHGYARGNEAVQYVDRIRTYHRVLLMAMMPEGLYGIGG